MAMMLATNVMESVGIVARFGSDDGDGPWENHDSPGKDDHDEDDDGDNADGYDGDGNDSGYSWTLPRMHEWFFTVRRRPRERGGKTCPECPSIAIEPER